MYALTIQGKGLLCLSFEAEHLLVITGSAVQTTPPVIRKKGHRVARGCLLIVGLFIVLGAGAYFYIRAPRFSGSTPVSIEITMTSPDSPTLESKVLIQATITNEATCKSLFALLRSARFRMDHKCGDIGSFTIRYTDGNADTLLFLPGHDPTRYEFRFGGWLYWLPRDQFYKVLRAGGVDTTKMPESEH